MLGGEKSLDDKALPRALGLRTIHAATTPNPAPCGHGRRRRLKGYESETKVCQRISESHHDTMHIVVSRITWALAGPTHSCRVCRLVDLFFSHLWFLFSTRQAIKADTISIRSHRLSLCFSFGTIRFPLSSIVFPLSPFDPLSYSP
jgi:hypothetical protein